MTKDEELEEVYSHFEQLIHPHATRDRLVGGVSGMVEAITDSTDVKVMKNATIYSGIGRLGLNFIVFSILTVSGTLVFLTSSRTATFINAMIAHLGGGMELETQATIMVWALSFFWGAVVVQLANHISAVVDRTGKGLVYYTKDDFFLAEHEAKKKN